MTKASPVNRLSHVLMLACGLCLGLITFALSSAAQAPPVVTGQILLETEGAHAGSNIKAAVLAQVASGYHINDHVPSLNYLIPTELKLDPTKPISVGSTVYPKGTPRKFEFLETPISVYEGRLLIGAMVRIDANAAPGVYTLKGALNYQACNDHACLPPASLPLTLAVKVVPQNEVLKPVNPDVFNGIKFN
jgi:DsbC/DsbD-like thiol-disulfide interchange protein